MAAVQATPWEQVSEKFDELTAHLRDRFDEVGADATADREAFEKSLRALASALEDTLTSAGRVVRDPVLRKDLAALAATLREALLSTFNTAGELRERIAAPVRRGRQAVTGRRSVSETAKGAAAAPKAAAAKAATTAKATGARTVSRAKTATTAAARKTTTRAGTARKSST